VNLKHLVARLAQYGKISGKRQISIEDVIPFIKNTDAFEGWKADFFCEITKGLREWFV